MVKKMPSRDGNELEDPGCLLRQLEDAAAPVVRSVTSLYFTQMQIRRGVYSRAAFISLSASNCAALIRGRRLFEGGVYSRKYGIYHLRSSLCKPPHAIQIQLEKNVGETIKTGIGMCRTGC